MKCQKLNSIVNPKMLEEELNGVCGGMAAAAEEAESAGLQKYICLPCKSIA